MRKWRILRIALLLVLPSAVLLFLVSRWAEALSQGLPAGARLEPDTLRRIGSSFFYVSLTILAVALVGRLLSPDAARRKNKTPMPALLRDLIRWSLFILLAALTLRWIWGDAFTPLIGALGIGGIVLGFALQDSLSNFFSGLSLLAERPFVEGDWVRIGERAEGMIEQITWRATKIRTRDNDYEIFPNSVVAKEVILNFNQPSVLHAIRIPIGTSYDDPPDKVRKVLLEVAAGVEKVARRPAPRVLVLDYGDFAIQYQLKCFVEDYENRPHIESEIRNRIWYAFRRNDIEIPFPIRTVYAQRATREAKGVVDLEAVLERTPVFAPLGPGERADLAGRVQVLSFAPGEQIVRQGDEGDTLYAIVSGTARITVRGEDGKEKPVAQLSAGQFFGEMSLLTGEPRTASVHAEDMLVLAAVSKDAFLPLLVAHPDMAEKLAEVVTLRREDLGRARTDASPERAPRPETDVAVKSLLGRIRRFFGL